jgi:hypothetical protein
VALHETRYETTHFATKQNSLKRWTVWILIDYILRKLTTCWRISAYAYHLPTGHRRRRSRRDFIPRRDRGSAAASSTLYGGPEASNPRRTSRPAAPLPPRPAHLLRYGPLLSLVQFSSHNEDAPPPPWRSNPLQCPGCTPGCRRRACACHPQPRRSGLTVSCSVPPPDRAAPTAYSAKVNPLASASSIHAEFSGLYGGCLDLSSRHLGLSIHGGLLW